MNVRYAVGIVFFFTITTVFAAKQKNMGATRAASMATQIVNTGISLNQQISSSSLNSAVTASSERGGSGGQFVITKSGRYFLSTDILAAPAASNIPCIYINASDVVLDLGGKTLTLSTTTNQKNSCAIEVAANKTGVTIMNGTINGRAGTSSVYTLTGIKFGSSVSNVLLDNVHVVNFGYDGLAFGAGSSDVILNNIHTYNIGFNARSYARGLAFVGTSSSACNDITILDSNFNKTNSSSEDLQIYGIYATYCNHIKMHNVNISNISNSMYTTGGIVKTAGPIRGIYLASCTGVECTNIKVLRCLSEVTSGSSAYAYPAPTIVGFDLSASTGCKFENCVANSAYSTHFTTSTYGFRLASSSHGNNFINCEAKNNLGAGTSCAFQLSASSFNNFQNCQAISNGGASHTTYGFQSGVDLTTTCSSNFFKQCKANSNRATVGHVYGFALKAEGSSAIQQCEASANIASGTCYGIALQNTCLKNVVEYNNLYANVGTVGQYGFKDFAGDSTTMLRGNVAFGHGATFSGGDASLTDSGSMNYFLRYTEATGQMNIQLLIKEGDIANMNAFEIGSPNWFNFSILHNSIAG
ncbi:hypothetical protein FJ364_00405 [Candidatus Dependentiae bacterium]|nr:hypothetical protein [Candidatus Dependentiae bacterium]